MCADTVPVTHIGRPGYVTMTVTATDEGGLPSEPVAVIIPLLDPNDERLNDIIKEYVGDWNAKQLGELRTLATTDLSIDEGAAGNR